MRPIIRSRLDVDFYKFTMGQFVFLNYPNVITKFAFKNRTANINLLEYIDENELRWQLDEFSKLQLTTKEIKYLGKIEIRKNRMFNLEYLDFLRKIHSSAYILKKYCVTL